MDISASNIGVDCHFHVFNAGQAIAGARYVPAYEATLARWSQASASVGISHGVLIQPSFLGTNNLLLLETLAAHAGRLRGVVVVTPDIPRHELAAMHALGVRGVRFNLAGRSHDLSGWSRQHAFWENLLSLGWHVQVHTDRGRLPEVLPLLPSDLHVVVDHMAKPLRPVAHDPTLSLLRRWGPQRVSVKLSAAYRLGEVSPQELAQALLAELGPSALLWGSDWPCTNFESHAHYPSLYANLAQWLPAAQVEQVIRTNPMRVYGGLGGGISG